ncbi:MAG: hypothetical protein NT085_00610 [candidate division SR1 bacterium]|nr:hypothetical protein [candidate division SR1 bacterium]
MIDQAPQKKVLKIDLQKITSFLDVIKKYLTGLYNFFKDNKNNSKIMLIIAIITSALAIFFGIQLYNDITSLNAKSSVLNTLSSYDTRTLEADPITQNILKNSDTIKDLIQENTTTEGEISKYTDYLSSLQTPYTYLLKYVYLPSLNVWKENYTDKIDTNLIGIKFLEKNPFNDITLLQKRGDFFKNLGDNNESNDILDMNIGDITEDTSGFFNMPITVSFVANSKRAFLLLADKLSMTSNKENISLINEFFYYLRGEIKKGKATEIKALESSYTTTFGSGQAIDQDKLIGYNLYNRIYNGGKNTLIDDTIIDKTIKSIISCNNETDEVCYYKFRERYRDIPTFGYLLGTDFGTNGAENLKRFMLQLPPIFSIQSFEFDKIKSPTLSDAANSKYQGKVTIVVYGRSASAQEVDQIAQALGSKCLGEVKPLTTQDGISLIQSAIMKLSDVNKIDKSYGDNLRELKGIVDQLNTDFPTLSNYKKTIKLFELYRMLSDAGLCK